MTPWLLLPPWGMGFSLILLTLLVGLLLARSWREKGQLPWRRQIRLLALRALVIVGLITIALNPNLLRPQKTDTKPLLTLLLDTSASMATRDHQGHSRLQGALEVLQDPAIHAHLQQTFALDSYSFDRSTRPIVLPTLQAKAASGSSSELGSALNQTINRIKNQPQAGVLLISDGRSTDESALDAARLALAHEVPLWTWRLGGPVARRDLWLEVPSHEAIAFAEDEVVLSGILRQTGYAHQSFAVELRRKDKVLQTQEVLPGPKGSKRFSMKIKAPRQGEWRYVFRVVGDHTETNRQNNEASIYLRVIKEKVRVLLVEGEPHWDSKFLVQTLKRNSRIEVTALSRINAQRTLAVVSTTDRRERTAKDLFPRTAKAFNQYDVIFMGRGCESFFDAQTAKHISEFVRQGGNLIFNRGKAYGGRFPALARLEPVVWGSGIISAVQLTDDAIQGGPLAALSKQAYFKQLPRFDRVRQTLGVKPLAEILATGQTARNNGLQNDYPIMIHHFYGQGRVVTINASGLWRWAFHDRDEHQATFFYERFWLDGLRWLLAGGDFLAGHDIALRSDWRLYTDEMSPQFLIRTRGLVQAAYHGQLTVTGPDTHIEITPRRLTETTFLAETSPLAPALYTVTLQNNIGKPSQLSLGIEVISSSIEHRNLSADPDLMAKLAEISEGQSLRGTQIGQLDRIYQQWQTRRQMAQQRQPLWHHWWWLGLLVIALAAEWWLRRREGLL